MKELNRDELLKVLGGGNAEVEVITYGWESIDSNGNCYGQTEEPQREGLDFDFKASWA